MSDTENKYSDTEDMPVHFYSSESKNGILKTLKKIFKEFPVAHSLGFRFAERNIRARYRQSVLGVLWALLPPLATAAIWIILNHNNIIKVSDTGTNYPLFVITGTMLWSVFTNALLMPIQTIQANTGILVKINFPREALMITAFYEILFNTAVVMVIIACEIIVFHVPLTMHSLLFFPAMLALILLGMCLGLLILPIATLYKDIQFALPTLLQFAMYLTPVVYAAPMFNGAAKILELNPVSPLLTSARAFLLGMDVQVPFGHLSIIALVSVAIFIVGIIFQRMTIEILIERMGS